jgi:hypothetical protein
VPDSEKFLPDRVKESLKFARIVSEDRVKNQSAQLFSGMWLAALIPGQYFARA